MITKDVPSIKEHFRDNVSNNFIDNAIFQLRFIEFKLVFVVFSMVEPDDKSSYIYKFKMEELIDFLEMQTSKGAKHEIIKSLKSLRDDKTKKFVIRNEDGSTTTGNWFATLTDFPKDGKESIPGKEKYDIIGIEISRSLEEYLFNIKRNFTSFEIGQLLNLDSMHHAKLYIHLKRIRNLKDKYLSTEFMREVIFCVGSKYHSFPSLEKKIIIPAFEAIRERTDIKDVHYEKVKKGKGGKVIGIRISDMCELVPDTTILKLLQSAIGMNVRDATNTLNTGFSKIQDLTSRGEARKVYASPEKFLEVHVEYFQQQEKRRKEGQDPISNRGGYFNSLLQKDAAREYFLKKEKAAEKKKAASLKKAKVKELKTTIESLEDEIRSYESALNAQKQPTIDSLVEKNSDKIKEKFYEHPMLQTKNFEDVLNGDTSIYTFYFNNLIEELYPEYFVDVGTDLKAKIEAMYKQIKVLENQLSSM